MLEGRNSAFSASTNDFSFAEKHSICVSRYRDGNPLYGFAAYQQAHNQTKGSPADRRNFHDSFQDFFHNPAVGQSDDPVGEMEVSIIMRDDDDRFSLALQLFE